MQSPLRPLSCFPQRSRAEPCEGRGGAEGGVQVAMSDPITSHGGGEEDCVGGFVLPIVRGRIDGFIVGGTLIGGTLMMRFVLIWIYVNSQALHAKCPHLHTKRHLSPVSFIGLHAESSIPNPLR